jgi:predicted Zn-dependent protease
VSVRDEQQLGAQFERQMRSEVVLVTDPAVNEYVRGIGNRILQAAGPQPFVYEFHVVDAPEINAFAGPGGQIYVNSTTILKTRNVSELAGVVAHEIGHVARRHVAQNLERQQAAGAARQLGVLAGGVLFGEAGAGLVNLGSGLASIAVLNSFSRSAEGEADAFAVQVLPRAGYDPDGLVTFFITLQREDGGGAGASFLSSHPATGDRIAATQALIGAQPKVAGLRTDDNGKLEIIQRRLVLLTKRAPPPQRGRR